MTNERRLFIDSNGGTDDLSTNADAKSPAASKFVKSRFHWHICPGTTSTIVTSLAYSAVLLWSIMQILIAR
ncbi:hypothetical protein SISSUDRAFT_1053159 [Sistotremastrum suecicum HHB10207 ss-3]|uniref:Uncharacterized protein n=1 Tax=Sistotremastrum suecicum HHB10207 ss-3 TaxID=1314776 RepID=A0A165ZDE0_9AGAM|nr:hypothetical protein SISSUDRAFT_1053159 [Sistotremastrum suecicum HHB10207 ss-3]